MRQADGYGTIGIYSAAGTLVRTLSTETRVYEVPHQWSADGAQLLYVYQDIFGDGGSRLALRPRDGGPSRPINNETGLAYFHAMFVPGDQAVVAIVAPSANSLSRVAVPAPR